MGKQLSVETAVCTEHERLNEECQQALETWDEHRATFCRTQPIAPEAGNELLRLQTKYARAYAVLQRHTHNCLLCQMAQGIEERESGSHPHGRIDSREYDRAATLW